jgi:alkaline phosphatase D
MGRVLFRRSSVSRREFFTRVRALTLSGAAATLSVGCGSDGSSPQSSSVSSVSASGLSDDFSSVNTSVLTAGRFQYGVANGDPFADSVLLWTAVTPAAGVTTAVVAWELSLTQDFSTVLKQGRVATGAARDFTVKVVVEGLAAATQYFYRFKTADQVSPTARTKTAPAASASALSLSFALTSCSNFPVGYFNAYRTLAQKPLLDAIFTLGDYLYEYGPNDAGGTVIPGRTVQPAAEMLTLADYRLRHRSYKLDPDLQEAHRLHPWICTWDDHESTNDSYVDGAENHTEGAEGKWSERKRFSVQAYFEWMPVRETNNPLRSAGNTFYRKLAYGNLCDIFVLETRLLARTKQAEDAAGAANPINTMTGTAQERFLLEGLLNSNARWKLVAQQTMVSPLLIAPNRPFTLDSWDGYTVQRARILNYLLGQNPQRRKIDNVIVLTGDIHTSFGCELPVDPAASEYVPGVSGSAAVELVCTSVTNVGFPQGTGAPLMAINRNMRYTEPGDHGYTLLQLTQAKATAEWYYNATILLPSDVERLGGVAEIETGEPYLKVLTMNGLPVLG